MLTNLAIWFAALGALNVGIGTYSYKDYKDKSIALGCVFCIVALILDFVDIFV